MFTTRTFLAALLAGLCLAVIAPADDKKEEKKDKSKEGKKGTVVGTLSAKSDNWIEVTADGEEKGRRYVPHWRGGAPAAGGGLDKKMLAVFKTLKVGSRVRVEWAYEERYRAEKVEVLKAPRAKDGK